MSDLAERIAQLERRAGMSHTTEMADNIARMRASAAKMGNSIKQWPVDAVTWPFDLTDGLKESQNWLNSKVAGRPMGEDYVPVAPFLKEQLNYGLYGTQPGSKMPETNTMLDVLNPLFATGTMARGAKVVAPAVKHAAEAYRGLIPGAVTPVPKYWKYQDLPVPAYAGGGSVNPAKWIKSVRQWLEPAIIAPSGPKQWRGLGPQGALGNSLSRLQSFEAEGGDPTAEALNKYIEGPLKRYITNRMGTADDEIRQLAGKGTVLTQMREMPLTPRKNLANKRVAEGYPARGLAGESGPFHPAARNWEDRVDNYITQAPASEFQNTRFPTNVASDDSWLNKVPPETQTFNLNTSDIGRDLGFDHMLDALNAEMQAGRLNPRNLNAISIEQAVRITSDYDKRLVEEARKASLEATKGNLLQTPTKEYSNGYRWIELPDTSKEEAAALCKAIGKQGGWCTMNDVSYGAHPSKLHVLIDPEGNPHAQIQERGPVGLRGEEQNKRTFDKINAAGADADDQKVWDHYYKLVKEEAKASQPPDLLQIKPLNNNWDSARVNDWTTKNSNYRSEITPMLQDFVRSKDWGEIRDLENTGLYPINSFAPERQKLLVEKYGPKKFYSTEEGSSVFEVPTQNFASGGAVRTQRLQALHARAYAGGGMVSAYPQQRYVQKGLRPEAYDPGMLRALGQAFARAEKKGILPPEAKAVFQTLPLVEGPARHDYGVNETDFAAKHRPMLDQIGITIGIPGKFAPAGAALQEHSGGGNPTWYSVNPGEASQEQKARLATMLFRQKLDSAQGNLDKATQLWNGSGPLSRAYLQKFKESQGLLSHPLNADYLNAFESGYANAAD